MLAAFTHQCMSSSRVAEALTHFRSKKVNLVEDYTRLMRAVLRFAGASAAGGALLVAMGATRASWACSFGLSLGCLLLLAVLAHDRRAARRAAERTPPYLDPVADIPGGESALRRMATDCPEIARALARWQESGCVVRRRDMDACAAFAVAWRVAQEAATERMVRTRTVRDAVLLS